MKNVYLILLFITLTAHVSFAQKVGDVALLQTDHNASVHEMARTSFGQPTPGKKVADIGYGNIMEGKYIGNGYYTVQEPFFDKPLIIRNFDEIKPEIANPSYFLDSKKSFFREHDSTDKSPEMIEFIRFKILPEDADSIGNVRMDYSCFVNPRDKKNDGYDVTYAGRSFQYGAVITHILRNGEFEKMPAPWWIYNANCWVDYRESTGIICINGNTWFLNKQYKF